MACESLKAQIAPTAPFVAIILFILNIFIPGLGTMINAYFGLKVSITTFFVGVA
jgi:hypothetical protein